jgi:hypothetical protein
MRRRGAIVIDATAPTAVIADELLALAAAAAGVWLDSEGPRCW